MKHRQQLLAKKLLLVISLPNNKILALNKFEEFADDKFNAAKILISFFDRAVKHCGKRRKCWLPAFSSFPTMFLKGLNCEAR